MITRDNSHSGRAGLIEMLMVLAMNIMIAFFIFKTLSRLLQREVKIRY
ncbi:MAG: hypothetical protein K6E34_02545 [Lachnospiraceae bacterium]|nr:hypothetical protein [Lachnospiraceae bacterium]